ncbi:MAG: hypothetical protein GWQ05_07570 [Verrucomicrobiaceae bacterium]|nr:hypothetical protein [Verrucomicrobiaceae bacterium]NCF90804.1 hypothetical protein [Verrucomicrobiaceae bacterium]
MSVKFRDYYEVLDVERCSSKDDIRKPSARTPNCVFVVRDYPKAPVRASGDLYVRTRIEVPESVPEDEKALWELFCSLFEFNPLKT